MIFCLFFIDDDTNLGDLWKIVIENETVHWSWESGSDVCTTNVGCRGDSSGWIQSDGNLRLYAGRRTFSSKGKNCNRYKPLTFTVVVNDIWEHQVSTSEWISLGNKEPSQGEIGVPNTSNWPRKRFGSMFWNIGDKFWFFGGQKDWDGTSKELWFM